MSNAGIIGAAFSSLFSSRPSETIFDLLQSTPNIVSADQSDTVLDNCPLPISHQSEEELEQSWYVNRGEKLADLGQWHQLGQDIIQFDKMHATTASGMPIAEALTLGARDVILSPIRRALKQPGTAPNLEIFHQVHEALHKDRKNYGLAAVLCLAHVDAGFFWAKHASRVKQTLAEKTQKRHFEMAQEILNNFNAFEMESPLLALTQCAILPGLDDPALRFCEDYEDLIELDPTTPQHFLKFGIHLLPKWFGSYPTLDNYARKLSKTTQEFWGSGAYALIYAGAIAQDVQACEEIDPEFFLTALLDVMERRTDQHAANYYAAFLTLTLADIPHRKDTRVSQRKRQKISEAAEYVIEEYLHEIHPLIWYRTAVTLNPALQSDHLPTQKLYGGMIAAKIIDRLRNPG